VGTIGRNEPCPCGSGLKFKRCCALKEPKASWSSRVVISVIGLMLLAGAIVMLMSLDELGQTPTCPPGQVWSPEHLHCH
jgi:hypothetical protein